MRFLSNVNEVRTKTELVAYRKENERTSQTVFFSKIKNVSERTKQLWLVQNLLRQSASDLATFISAAVLLGTMTTSQVDQSTLVAGRQAIQGTWRLDGRTDGRWRLVALLMLGRHTRASWWRTEPRRNGSDDNRRTPAALINYGRRSGVSRRPAGFALTSAPCARINAEHLLGTCPPPRCKPDGRC